MKTSLLRPFLGILCACLLLGSVGCGVLSEDPRILVLTETEGYRHGSIDAGLEALRAVAAEQGLEVDTARTGAAFTEENLRRYQAVVFLNTSGDVLDYYQQADFERYIQAGGGFVGIHAAADTERDWPWYGELVGAYFDEPLSGDRVAPRVLTVADASDPATSGLPESWERTDEWFRYTSVSPDVHVLVSFDDGQGGELPFAWRHEYDGGRAFYVAGGHTAEAFAEPDFRRLLAGGLRYAVGEGDRLDYDRARSQRLPDETRFAQTVLAEGLDEPTELVVLPDGRVLFTERKGAVKVYDPAAGAVETIATFELNTTHEDGLMGVGLDPNFAENDWIYFYYSDPDESDQNLSRFELRGDSLLMETEQVVLEVPTQREECCHTGGSIEFGPDGLLYLSTGDNTNPFESQGYAPIDGRPGRAPFDARRTSANTNDLRGKILRIRPEADGTYSIPEGNLFVDDDPRTRPEIYVMGNRNPYRISVDPETGYLYWGEVGPDAGEGDPQRGPRGHDEVNQAREAGFFGWPLFVGDNKPYRAWNFATQTAGEYFDASAPVNESPYNTGLRSLPPAQEAFIWYPYAESPEFPILGTGGRTAMAGPVFHAERFEDAEGTFPEYYDDKLFIYEWMRGWIHVVTMDDDGDLEHIEPFMPSTRFRNPVDMVFADDGTMYLLEYGTGWFSRNPDARLSRITYNAGNRAPVVRVEADRTLGGAPLTVQFSTEGTRDHDGDDLNFTWDMVEGGGAEATGASPSFTFTEPGLYTPTVTVTDAQGSTATATVEVRVGNAPPEVDLAVTGNQTFFWDDAEITYDVSVQDPEDGALGSGIAPEEVRVQFDYLPQGYDQTLIAQGHQSTASTPAFHEGLRMIEGSDCQACHKVDAASIGPSFMQVAERYEDDPTAVAQLADKIIKGGGGVWGDQAMAAHPQISQAEAEAMVEYILTLTESAEDQAPSRPLEGTFAPRAHLEPDVDSPEGTYILRAAYTDRGAGALGPLTSQDIVVLRHPRIQAETYDAAENVGRDAGSGDEPALVKNIFDGSHLLFRDLDLTGVEQVVYAVRTAPLNEAGGRIELRLDAPDGPLVSTAVVPEGRRRAEITAPVEGAEGVHDLYLVFRNDEVTGEPLFLLDWLRFDNH